MLHHFCRVKNSFLSNNPFFDFFQIFFLHGIGSWYHKLSFKTLLAKIGSLLLEIFIFLFFSDPYFGKMLFGQRVQKFWEYIKKLYRSLSCFAKPVAPKKFTLIKLIIIGRASEIIESRL